MAGDWIKIETTTPTKPELAVISTCLGVNMDEALGILVRWFIIVDQQCASRSLFEASLCHIDALIGVSKFSDALVKVGWLTIENGVVVIPNYDRHNGKSAKRRSLRMKSQRLRRSQSEAQLRPRQGLTLGLEIEKEIKKKKSTSSPQAQPEERTKNPIWDSICEVWRLNPVTDSERSRVGKLARDFKAKGAEPEEIRARLERYRSAWPNAADTPEAILKHWDRFGDTSLFDPEALARKQAEALDAMDAVRKQLSEDLPL